MVFGYGLSGNMTSVTGTLFGSKTLVYDDESRLTSITSGGVTDQCWYNVMGQRTRAILNGAAKRYTYDGARVLEQTDDAGSMVARYANESGSFYQPLLHLRVASGSLSRHPLV